MDPTTFFPTTPFSLQGLYANRLDAAWQSLRQDIKRWQSIFSATTMIRFHIDEFATFSEEAYTLLVPATAAAATAGKLTRIPLTGPLDAEDFRAVVIGVLTAHWGILRQVATQRVSGSPYLPNLEKLDDLAAGYYYRLRALLPLELQAQVKSFAPLIHLGAIGSITVFNQNVPLVVSVPYNAIDSYAGVPNDISTDAEKSKLAIPHEIGHAILLQVPALLAEIKSKVTRFLLPTGKTVATRRQILAGIIVGWLEEILADMLGTALARENFVVGAMWITASSESNIGLSDAEHPPTLVRPSIHLAVLRHLNQHRKSDKSARDIQTIEEQSKDLFPTGDRYVTEIAHPYLNRQFKSIPALTFMTLAEVKAELDRVVKYLLKPTTTLKTLAGKTLGEFLIDCDDSKGEKPQTEREQWGKIQATERSEFALTLPSNFDPDFQAPMTLSKGICWIPIIGEIICA